MSGTLDGLLEFLGKKEHMEILNGSLGSEQCHLVSHSVERVLASHREELFCKNPVKAICREYTKSEEFSKSAIKKRVLGELSKKEREYVEATFDSPLELLRPKNPSSFLSYLKKVDNQIAELDPSIDLDQIMKDVINSMTRVIQSESSPELKAVASLISDKLSRQKVYSASKFFEEPSTSKILIQNVCGYDGLEFTNASISQQSNVDGLLICPSMILKAIRSGHPKEFLFGLIAHEVGHQLESISGRSFSSMYECVSKHHESILKSMTDDASIEKAAKAYMTEIWADQWTVRATEEFGKTILDSEESRKVTMWTLISHCDDAKKKKFSSGDNKHPNDYYRLGYTAGKSKYLRSLFGCTPIPQSEAPGCGFSGEER